MNIGEKIKYLRTNLNLTQEDLAFAAGTTKQTIHKYETGIISNIPASKIKAIADKLETTPSYLMGWHISEEKALEPSILTNYNKLNSLGQQRADAYIDDLLENPKYRKETSTPQREYTFNDYGEIAAYGADGTRGTFTTPPKEIT